MARFRLHGLKCLAYAVALLALSPCLIEFWLRVAAFRTDCSSPVDRRFPAVLPDGFVHHQLAPLQIATIPGGPEAAKATFRTNSLGIRGSEIRVPKPANVLRIICLGDETILAASQPDDLTFLAPLKNHLQPHSASEIEIINAAVPESCPLLANLQFRHQLLGLQPDILILHFDPTDLADDERYRRLTDLDASDAPLVCVHPTLQAKPKIKPLCEHFLCVNWLNRAAIGWLESHPDEGHSDATSRSNRRQEWWRDSAFQQADRVSSAIRPCTQLAQSVKSVGCRVVLVVHPAVEQLLVEASQANRGSEAKSSTGATDDRVTPLRIVTELERGSELVVCRITETLRRVKDPQTALAEDRRSLTPFGHEVYAYALAETLFRAMPNLWSTPSEASAVTPASGTHKQARPAREQPGNEADFRPQRIQTVE